METTKSFNINVGIETWKANQNAGANMININKDVINNLSKGQSIADIQEATGNQVLVYGNENDKAYGFYDNNGKQIYINAESGAVINTDTFIKTYGHETGHKYTKNEEIAKNSGSFGSFIYGLSNMTSFTGVNRDGEGVGDGAGAITTDSWKQSQMSSWDNKNMLVNNSNMAGGVREEDRSDFKKEGGVHINDMLESDEISDYVKERILIGKPTFESESGGLFNRNNKENSEKDPGGMSYGVGQIATEDRDKTMQKFEDFLKQRENGNTFYLEYGSNFYTDFMKAGGAEGAKVGTKEFLSFWNNASQYSDFARLQVDFLHQNNYEPAKDVFTNHGYNIDDYSLGAKNLVYSTGVQYGSKGTNKLLNIDIKEAQKNNMIPIMNGIDSQAFKDSLTETKQTYVNQSFPSYINGSKDKPNSEATKIKNKNDLIKRWEIEYEKSKKVDKK